jgi:hypothetical protein
MLTRPPVKQTEIIAGLRAQILRGVLQTGTQLPTRAAIEKRFHASRATVQRALDALAQDGFVYARGRTGTFVAENPPHLTRYGVVFHRRPAPTGEWSRFWTAIRNEVLALEGINGRRFPIYYGPEAPADESYRELCEDVARSRLAGIFFASRPDYLAGAPALEQPGLPRVAVMGRPLVLPASAETRSKKGGRRTPEERVLPVAAVDVDTRSFIDKALDYFAARRRRRVAVVLASQGREYREYLVAALARRGLRTEPYWLQTVYHGMPEAARNCVHLLMRAGQGTHPDGLLITDDNLIENATAGLIAAGARVPDGVEVVVHCNFPWRGENVLPLRRLGYDVRSLIRICIERIDQQRRGERWPALTLVPALFEDEES